jgi:uncharacterized protein (DUF1501 family)
MSTRRTFLKRLSLLALSSTVPGFIASTVRAAPTNGDGHSDRKLVVVQLTGGNDGINTVVPYSDEGYARARKELRLATPDLLRIDDELGFHPAMKGMARLLDDGRFAVIQGVGYPNPSRSHFESMAVWHTARFDHQTDGSRDSSQGSELGWLGRALDGINLIRGRAPRSVYVGLDSSPALRGRHATTASFSHLRDLRLASHVPSELPSDQVATGGELTAFVRRSLLDAYTAANQLDEVAPGTNSATAYPSSKLASDLRLVSRMVKAGFDTRVYYVEQGGYDTHALQLPRHQALLAELSGALHALVDDLRNSQLLDSVAVLVFSEFGRRVAENNGRGTDHGTAAPVFVAGGKIRGGLVGRTPSLLDLADGDLKTHVDFRQVYATLLEDWLHVPSRDVLGGEFDQLSIFQQG